MNCRILINNSTVVTISHGWCAQTGVVDYHVLFNTNDR